MYEQDVNNSIHFNLSKLILMGIISLVLCMSFIMSIFTPFPIAFAAVIYGRSKGYGIGVCTWLVSLLLSVTMFGDLTVFIAYTMSLIVAVLISEVVQRQLPPVRSMVKLGSSIIAMVGLFFLFLTQGLNVDLKANLVEQIKKNKEVFELQQEKLKQAEGASAENFEAMAMLSQPEVLATEVLKEAPSYFVIGTFLIIWANLFLLLRSHRMINLRSTPRYTERDLLSVKVPDQMIWAVIAALILAVWGESLGNSVFPIIGINVLKFLGIFYFFQGFGIYLDFLNFARITGFFRTVLVMLTIFTAAQFIAIVGLFDMFVNFRRFFKKNKNEGEQ
jgi:hypothetical protein